MGPTSKDATTNGLGATNQKISSKLHCDWHELLGSREDNKFWAENLRRKLNLNNFSLLGGLLLHGNMGPTLLDATTNRLGDHKPKNLIETSEYIR